MIRTACSEAGSALAVLAPERLDQSAAEENRANESGRDRRALLFVRGRAGAGRDGRAPRRRDTTLRVQIRTRHVRYCRRTIHTRHMTSGLCSLGTVGAPAHADARGTAETVSPTRRTANICCLRSLHVIARPLQGRSHVVGVDQSCSVCSGVTRGSSGAWGSGICIGLCIITAAAIEEARRGEISRIGWTARMPGG